MPFLLEVYMLNWILANSVYKFIEVLNGELVRKLVAAESYLYQYANWVLKVVLFYSILQIKIIEGAYSVNLQRRL